MFRTREHERDSPKLNVWCRVSSAGIVGPYIFLLSQLAEAPIICICSRITLWIISHTKIGFQDISNKTEPPPISRYRCGGIFPQCFLVGGLAGPVLSSGQDIRQTWRRATFGSWGWWRIRFTRHAGRSAWSTHEDPLICVSGLYTLLLRGWLKCVFRNGTQVETGWQ